MKASLIIPTYNKLPRLRLTLASLRLQKLDPQQFEIIVVDDGSDDETESYCRSGVLPSNGRYIRQRHAGRASARNHGLQEAQNDILVFVDDDLLLGPSFLETHLRWQEKELSIIHGKIMEFPYLRFFEDPIQGILYEKFQSRSDVKYKLLMAKCFNEMDIKNDIDLLIKQARRYEMDVIAEKLLTSRPMKAAWMAFSGGNISVPRDWLVSQQGFDETFGTVWGCEDLELGYRLWKCGYPFHYASDAVNYHLAHYRADYMQEHTKSVQYFYEKHKDDSISLFHQLVIKQLSTDEFLRRLV